MSRQTKASEKASGFGLLFFEAVSRIVVINREHSPQPERNPHDHLATETVLQAFENLFALVADDFTEPRAVVHVDEERAFVQTHRLRVRDDVRINQAIPHLHDLSVIATLFHAESNQDLRDEIARAPGTDFLRDLQWSDIHATPLSEDALLGGTLQAARSRTLFGWWQHESVILNSHRW